jgi:hypothetical protein
MRSENINIATILLLLFAIVGDSCSSKSEKIKDFDSLSVTRSIEIDVSNKQYEHQAYQVIGVNQQPFLYGLDISNKTIDVFDLENGEYYHQIDFSAEKLNILEIDQFYVHNQDSIFLYSIPFNSLYLINSESQLIDIWDFDLHFSSPKPNLSVFNVLVSHNYFNGFAYKKQDTSMVATIFLFDGIDFLNDDAYGYPPMGKFRLTSEPQSPLLFGEFPKSYHNNEVPFDMYYSLEVSDDNTLLNFSFSSQVYESKSNSFHTIKSHYDTDAITYSKGKDPEMERVIQDINTGLVYLRTFPLDNKKLIRVCKVPQRLKDEENLYNQFVQSPWSIILYDVSSRKVEKEYYFEANSYDFRHVLPFKNGVYVLKENPYDKLNNEEILEVHYYAIR